MRIPRIKLSIRGMMVAIAVGALFLWAGMAGCRCVVYLRRASVHEQTSRAIYSQIMTTRFYLDLKRSKGQAVPASADDDLRHREADLQSHQEMARKYREAASHPWRSIADDRNVDVPRSPR